MIEADEPGFDDAEIASIAIGDVDAARLRLYYHARGVSHPDRSDRLCFETGALWTAGALVAADLVFVDPEGAD